MDPEDRKRTKGRVRIGDGCGLFGIVADAAGICIGVEDEEVPVRLLAKVFTMRLLYLITTPNTTMVAVSVLCIE